MTIHVFEAAAIVFPRTTRSLHNSVERDERQNDELSHIRCSAPPCRWCPFRLSHGQNSSVGDHAHWAAERRIKVLQPL